ncbi:hypothetical protein ACFLZY_02210 [Patescibacteria group bacterium]
MNQFSSSQFPETRLEWPESRKPKFPWLKFLVIGALVVLVFGFGLWLYFGRGSGLQNEMPVTFEQVKIQAEQRMALCQRQVDQFNCQTKATEELIDLTRDVKVCQLLDDLSLKENCIWNLALKDLHVVYCSDLSASDLIAGCQDAVYSKLARAESDISYCQKIINEVRQQGCQRAVEGPVTAVNCLDRGFDQTYCQDIGLIEQAKKLQDTEVCDQISNLDQKGECYERVGYGDKDFDRLSTRLEDSLGTDDTKKDTDDDGLSDYDEYKKYKTDPLNPDTDGDGFTDGTEVKNGYNPSGEGKL